MVAGALQFLSRRDSAVPLENRQLVVMMISHKALRALGHHFWLVQTAAAAAVGFARGVLGRQSVAWRRFQRPAVDPA